MLILRRKINEHKAELDLLLSIFIFLNSYAVFGPDVKLLEEIEFSEAPETKTPQVIWSFCVTEDEISLIPDQQAGDKKVYEKIGRELKLAHTIGKKGFGRDELAEPYYCFYSRNENKFGVLDFGKRKIIIYDRVGRMAFRPTYTAPCMVGRADIQLVGNSLLISGYKGDQNEKPYDLYSFDLNELPIDQTTDFPSARPTFLLPSYSKYNLNSPQEYDIKFRSETDIKTIEIKGWFDAQGDDVYFVWEGATNKVADKLLITLFFISPVREVFHEKKKKQKRKL